MKILSRSSSSTPNYAIYAILFSHILYIYFLFQYAARPRVLVHLLLGYCLGFGLELLLRKIRGTDKNQKFPFWICLAIVNSTFINSELVSIYGLVIGVGVAFLSKAVLLNSKGVHIFNPSILGVVTAAVFFPNFLTSSLHSFPVLWPENFILIAGGLLTVILARTWMISLSYQISFYILYFLLATFMSLNGFDPSFEGIYDLETRYLAQTTTGIIILTFGVISDPKTAPKGILNQACFGFVIALIDFSLRENALILSEAFAYLGAQGLWSIFNELKKKKRDTMSTSNTF